MLMLCVELGAGRDLEEFGDDLGFTGNGRHGKAGVRGARRWMVARWVELTNLAEYKDFDENRFDGFLA